MLSKINLLATTTQDLFRKLLSWACITQIRIFFNKYLWWFC